MLRITSSRSGTSTKISKALSTPPFCEFPSLYVSYDHCQRTPKWHSLSSALIKSLRMVQTFFEIFNTIQTADLLVMRMKPTYPGSLSKYGSYPNPQPGKVIIISVTLREVSSLLHKTRSQKMWKMTDLTGYNGRVQPHQSPQIVF